MIRHARKEGDDTMSEFFNELSTLDKIFFVSAVAGGVLYVIRMILFFVGGDSDGLDGAGDVDLDADSSFEYLSIQSLTGFFMMFGLVGLACTSTGLHGAIAVGVATAAGFATVWITERIFHLIKQFQSTGNVQIENTLGQEARVYLTIPPDGVGKVQLSVQGRLREYEAVSESREEIPTGERVIVMRVVSGSCVGVSRMDAA